MADTQFQQKRTSKTLWFNIVSLVVLTVPVILTALKTIEPGWALLADSIGGMIVGIGNIVIRVYWTEKPLDTARNREKAGEDDLEQRLSQLADRR